MWRLEVANAFQSALRRKRISADYRDQCLGELAWLPITIDAEAETHAWTTPLRLAERFGLTIYDATYLKWAHRRALPLATLDKELWKAAVYLNACRWDEDMTGRRPRPSVVSGLGGSLCSGRRCAGPRA